MPYNPQTKVQSNLCTEILAKFIKHQEHDSYQKDSIIQNENCQIAQGKWEDDQNLKFIIFIDYHHKIFSSKQKRKSQKIFKTLSKFLGNRTPAQCRSHYQKIMIKFRTIAKLKKHFKQYFGEQTYNQNYQQFTEMWKEANQQEIQQVAIKTQKQTEQKGVQTEQNSQFYQWNFNQFLMYWQVQQFMNTFYSQNPIHWNSDQGSYQ